MVQQNEVNNIDFETCVGENIIVEGAIESGVPAEQGTAEGIQSIAK